MNFESKVVSRDRDFTRMQLSRTVYEEKACGYRTCMGCGAQTPDPTPHDLRRLMDNGDHFVWPFDDWQPIGWFKGYRTNAAGFPEQVILCPVCVAARRLQDVGKVLLRGPA